MTVPLVGVAMPAYNASRFIAETISSVLAQTLTDWELVVVNDGSTDHTADVVESFSDPRMRLVSQPNQGRGPARARAMQMTRGEYVAFLDADDLWEPEMLEMCICTFKAHPEAWLVHTNWRYLDEFGNKSNTSSYWQPWRGDVLERLILELPFITPGVVVQRQALAKVGLLDEAAKVVDDWDMWLQLALAGCQFECVERPLAYYRRHEANATHNFEMSYRDQLRVLDVFFSRSNIPSHIRLLRDKAYAKIHLQYATGLLRVGKSKAATDALRAAFSLDKGLLKVIDTYYTVAASPRSLTLAASNQRIDLTEAEECIRTMLQATVNNGRIPKFVLGNAYYALSQIAYWQGQDEMARRWMTQSLGADPSSLIRPQKFLPALRAMMGSNRIQHAKNMARSLSNHSLQPKRSE